ncbi:MAG: hypothetical protein ACXWRU_12125 [Pseudobdellovibrionaceae bacterium]
MEKIFEIDRKDISKQAQKIIKAVRPNSSADDKANAGLALSILSLLSVDVDNSTAQQLLKLLKTIQQ